MSAFQEMISRYAQPGVLEAIWLRPARLSTPVSVDQALIGEDGLDGDHGRTGKRAVTLIQAEHLAVIGAMLGRAPIAPALLRRNLVIGGVNLNALKGRQLWIGDVVLELTTVCAPCSRMEKALGPGGYSAMRGHGGWCARVISTGVIRVGDAIVPRPEDSEVRSVKVE